MPGGKGGGGAPNPMDRFKNASSMLGGKGGGDSVMGQDPSKSIQISGPDPEKAKRQAERRAKRKEMGLNPQQGGPGGPPNAPGTPGKEIRR
jgi:hypothetical protein